MRHKPGRLQRIAMSWRRTGANTRLAVGAILVIAGWFASLSPFRLAGMDLPWPLMILVAAVGWSRAGLYMRPVFLLIVLSLLFDISTSAPFGSYMLVALSAYGVQVMAQSALDMDNGAVLETAIPFFSLATGILALWGLASASSGYAIKILPIMMIGFATALAYVLTAPVFNLRTRYGGRAVGG
ncbi:MAG: hypothetical protein MRY64_09575 [Hyphomonadaceae bacterium]|nr:hypothetical protein [Hyphomonadaceae bacterium]